MNKYIKNTSIILMSFLLVGAGLLDGRQIKDSSVNLTTKVTGTLPQSNGGTGSTSLNSDIVSEGSTNLFYTTARARNSISGASPITYNSSTGSIGLNATTSDITEGSNLYYTTSRNRGDLSATSPINYNSSTGNFSLNALNSDSISEGVTNLYHTASRVRNSISATAPVQYNNTTGVISQTQSNTSTDGYVSSTDWNTFNNKINSVNGKTGATVTLNLNEINSPTTNYSMASQGFTSTNFIDLITGGMLQSVGSRLLYTLNNGAFFGVNSGNLTHTGTGNVGIGSGSMSGLTTGSSNTAIGANSGNIITTGANNVFIGNGATASTNAITNSVAIGQGVTVNANNTIFIGNASNTSTQLIGNLTFGTAQYGGGTGGVIYMPNATVIPATNPTSGIILYVSGNALRARTVNGNIRNIALP